MTTPRLHSVVAAAAVIVCIAASTAACTSDTAGEPEQSSPVSIPEGSNVVGTDASGSADDDNDIDSERVTPPDPTRSPFDTLPPVNRHVYPTGTDDVVVQVSIDERGPAVPLLTVYGDLEAVALTADGWRTGTITDFMLEQLLDEAASLGLLDQPIELRGPDSEAPPYITVAFTADAVDIVHEFDLARIERPPALRIFLNEWTSSNRFGLDIAFDPPEWITCDAASSDIAGESCRVVDEQIAESDRPLLPHESDASLLLP